VDAEPANTGTDALIDRIDDALPQTQCTRCGYPDCRAYASAIVVDGAAINRCPPGGAEGIARLAILAHREPSGLDEACGTEGPRALAVVDESWCIGCTLCIEACPVDCVVGAPRRMHTVIDDQCTGCELCVPACPVDCIAMQPISGAATGWQAWSPALAAAARRLYQARQQRLARGTTERQESRLAKATAKLADLAAASRHTDPHALERKRTLVMAAIERARAVRARTSG
jgi:electron transport complex protein RnfB